MSALDLIKDHTKAPIIIERLKHVENGGWKVYLFRAHEGESLQRIIYIGKTEHMEKRIHNHRRCGPLSRHAMYVYEKD